MVTSPGSVELTKAKVDEASQPLHEQPNGTIIRIQENSLCKLPPEMINAILDYLWMSDYARLAQTCKYFRALVRSDLEICESYKVIENLRMHWYPAGVYDLAEAAISNHPRYARTWCKTLAIGLPDDVAITQCSACSRTIPYERGATILSTQYTDLFAALPRSNYAETGLFLVLDLICVFDGLEELDLNLPGNCQKTLTQFLGKCSEQHRNILPRLKLLDLKTTNSDLGFHFRVVDQSLLLEFARLPAMVAMRVFQLDASIFSPVASIKESEICKSKVKVLELIDTEKDPYALGRLLDEFDSIERLTLSCPRYTSWRVNSLLFTIMKKTGHSLLSLCIDAYVGAHSRLRTSQPGLGALSEQPSSLKGFERLQLLRCNWEDIVVSYTCHPKTFRQRKRRLQSMLPSSLVMIQFTDLKVHPSMTKSIIDLLIVGHPNLRCIELRSCLEIANIKDKIKDSQVEIDILDGFRGWQHPRDCNCGMDSMFQCSNSQTIRCRVRALGWRTKYGIELPPLYPDGKNIFPRYRSG